MNFETVKVRREGAVVFAEITAPPMNLLGGQRGQDLAGRRAFDPKPPRSPRRHAPGKPVCSLGEARGTCRARSRDERAMERIPRRTR
jgi:hypothetical protein